MRFSNTKRWNSSLIKVAFAAIIIINLFFLVWSGWVVVRMPYSGMTLADDYRVVSIIPDSPADSSGFQIGDIIVAANGVGVSDLRALYSELHAGDVVVYSVIRDDELLFFTVQLTSNSFRQSLSEFEAILVGFIFWLVSLIVWAVASSSDVTKLFFLVGQTAALLFSTGTVSSFKNNAIENYVFAFALLLLTPLFLHFYLIFPRVRDGWRSRFFRNVIYGLAIFLDLVYISVTYFGIKIPWLVFINSQRLLFTSFGLLAALVSLFFSRAGTSMHTLRQQRLLIAGMLFSVLPLLLLSFLPQLLVSRPIIDYVWTFPFLILLPISYAYAVYKENLDAFDHFLKQGLLYLFSAGLLLIIYFVTVEILLLLFSSTFYHWWHFIAGVVVMMIAIIWGEWIKRSLDRMLDHFFYRHWYDYRSIIQQNSHYLSGTVRLERLAQSLLQNARTMRFLEAALLWDEKGVLRSYQSFGYSDEMVESFLFNKDDFIARKLTSISEPCLNQRLFSSGALRRSSVDARSKIFMDGRVQIWVPLSHGSGTLTGILLLGSRLGDEPLDKEDWDILGTLAGHISLAVENISLVETLRDQLEVMKSIQHELLETKLRLSENRERERLELARLLHDGPIQDIYGVIYQLAIWRKLQQLQDDPSLDTVEASLMTIEKRLRFFSSELRPPALDAFGLEGAIRSHVSNLRESHPDISFYPDLVRSGDSISLESKLALFRIYQEAMQNVIRHAKASKIWVRLFRHGEQIIFEIEDDGVGFVPPKGWMGLAREGHFGMLGIAERADIIGGELTVVSEPGKGTLIRVSIAQESQDEGCVSIWGQVSDLLPTLVKPATENGRPDRNKPLRART